MKRNFKIATFFLIIVVILAIYGIFIASYDESPKFYKLIEDSNIEDISLTIYYCNPFILTRAPISINTLINWCEESDNSDYIKIIVNGDDLKNNINLLKQVNDTNLISVDDEKYLNARIYYVFESEKYGEMFNVAMWGGQGSIFINGFAVEEKDIFYDIIIPFLPEEEVEMLEKYIGRENQGI